jgi:hypothetical protein
MTDNVTDHTSDSTPDNTRQAPLCLVRGNASPEEIAALVTVLAIAGGDERRPGRPASQWSTHRRVFHTTYPHGPGGWRASAFPH